LKPPCTYIGYLAHPFKNTMLVIFPKEGDNG
jgi:hypothetical protein